jgi:hypothetical protein
MDEVLGCQRQIFLKQWEGLVMSNFIWIDFEHALAGGGPLGGFSLCHL